MNKNAIGKRIRADRAKIIEMYQADTYVIDIANKYGVVESTIHRYLRLWGIPVKRKKHQHRVRKVKKFKRQFSQAFLVRRAEMERVCGGKVEYVSFERSTEDQRLVANIIRHPIIG